MFRINKLVSFFSHWRYVAVLISWFWDMFHHFVNQPEFFGVIGTHKLKHEKKCIKKIIMESVKNFFVIKSTY